MQLLKIRKTLLNHEHEVKSDQQILFVYKI